MNEEESLKQGRDPIKIYKIIDLSKKNILLQKCKVSLRQSPKSYHLHL